MVKMIFFQISHKIPMLPGSPALGLGFLLAFLMPGLVVAQNLIPNPSFEDFNNYTQPFREVFYLDTFPNPNATGLLHWGRPTGIRTNVFSDSILRNSGAFFRLSARTGQAHGSLGMGGTPVELTNVGVKQFYQTKLSDTLGKGCFYHFKIYLRPAFWNISLFPVIILDSLAYATNDFGAYFSKERISDRRGADTSNALYRANFSMRHFQDNHHFVPQVQSSGQSFFGDTAGYRPFSGSFQAEGGEQYLTIGSFRPAKDIRFKNLLNGQVVSATDTQKLVRSNLYVDDLSLRPLPPPAGMLNSPADTSICPGDTLRLGASSPDTSYGFRWDDGSRGPQRHIYSPGTYWVELVCPCQRTRRDTFVVEAATTLPELPIQDTTVCPSASLSLDLPEQGRYYLNNQRVAHSFAIPDSGRYTLRAEGRCQDQSWNFHLAHWPSPALPDLGLGDTAICQEGQLTRDLPPGFWYKLNGDFVDFERLQLKEKGNYRFAVGHQCDSLVYEFKLSDQGCQPIVFIPDAFTPNGDGLNDCFEISVQQHDSYALQIFNRWGLKIFTSDDPARCWDGTFRGEVLTGTYHYRLVVSNGGAGDKYLGTVTVLP